METTTEKTQTQSEKKTREFEPRNVEQSKLYKDNKRLQRLCYLHRKQIRGMQQKLELMKAQYESIVLKSRTPAEKREVARKLLAEARAMEGYKETV